MRFIVIVTLLIGCASSGDTLGVNEVAAHEPEDRGPDWVELHNPTTEAMALDGWALSTLDAHFVFPSGTTLQPEELILVWFGEGAPNIDLQAETSLPDVAFDLELTDDNGELMEVVMVPMTDEGTSYGLSPSGVANWQIIEEPSPHAPNVP